MYATYHINTDEMDFDFFQSIKHAFKGKQIEITILADDETDYLMRSERNKSILLKRIKDVEDGNNLTTFTSEEFEKFA